MKYFIHFIPILFLLSLLVVVTSCRTTRNASSSSQSDLVATTHETDSATSSQQLTIGTQRTLTLSIDSLFLLLSPGGLLIEVAETAPHGSRSGHLLQQSSASIAAYGIHVADSASALASGHYATESRYARADSTDYHQQEARAAKSAKTDLATPCLILLLIAAAIGIVLFLFKRLSL